MRKYSTICARRLASLHFALAWALRRLVRNSLTCPDCALQSRAASVASLTLDRRKEPEE